MSIQKYHESMFGGEHLHNDWIDDCARYLKSIFGDSICGRTVVDYGFGRGNWTLAFHRLGAKRVVSIDASQAAVDRFQAYIRENDIDGVEAILGNTDDGELNPSCDFVFLYGILHHLKDPAGLMRQASSWLARADGKILIYAYDKSGLREKVVSRCRAMAMDDLSNWAGWQGALHPLARQRAADDLVAPIVSFWSTEELHDLMVKSGLKCVSQVKDFSDFQGKSLAPEFDPYVVLATPGSSGQTEIVIQPNEHNLASDYGAIDEVLDIIAGSDQISNKATIAVGLFNTLFCTDTSEKFEDRLFYVWRYLAQLMSVNSQLMETATLNPATLDLLQMTIKRVPPQIAKTEMRHALAAYPTLSHKALSTSYRL